MGIWDDARHSFWWARLQWWALQWTGIVDWDVIAVTMAEDGYRLSPLRMKLAAFSWPTRLRFEREYEQ